MCNENNNCCAQFSTSEMMNIFTIMLILTHAKKVGKIKIRWVKFIYFFEKCMSARLTCILHTGYERRFDLRFVYYNFAHHRTI